MRWKSFYQRNFSILCSMLDLQLREKSEFNYSLANFFFVSMSSNFIFFILHFVLVCRLRSSFKSYNLIVASYDIVRKDIDFFSAIKWNYCILDEGQYIKNGKTKVCDSFFCYCSCINSNLPYALFVSTTGFKSNQTISSKS